ncbi:MAG: hypothetical protein ACREQW_10290 [Candidatus Binatia bacterium]
MKAKKEAESKGLIFETSHDEIVAKAKKEGTLKVLSGLDPSVYPSLMESFKKKYPFLKVEMVEITGPDSAQRFVMELKSGGGTDFDIAHASTEFYPEYVPFAKKFDLLGMAERGVLGIPPKMVDPKHRNIAALGSAIAVVMRPAPRGKTLSISRTSSVPFSCREAICQRRSRAKNSASTVLRTFIIPASGWRWRLRPLVFPKRLGNRKEIEACATALEFLIVTPIFARR